MARPQLRRRIIPLDTALLVSGGQKTQMVPEKVHSQVYLTGVGNDACFRHLKLTGIARVCTTRRSKKARVLVNTHLCAEVRSTPLPNQRSIEVVWADSASQLGPLQRYRPFLPETVTGTHQAASSGHPSRPPLQGQLYWESHIHNLYQVSLNLGLIS